MFCGRVFQTVCIPMSTNCANLPTDVFLYSHEADIIQGLLKKNQKKLAQSFNFRFRYTDDVLSLNNSRFGDFADCIYPIELEIKDTTDTDMTASYLDLDLETDSEGWLRTNFTTKGMISIFPLICKQHSSSTCIYNSQLIRYSRACGSYQDFLDRGLLLPRKLLNKGLS